MRSRGRIPRQLRHPGIKRGFELIDGKRAGGEQGGEVTVQVAAVAEAALQGSQAALPSRDAQAVGQTVLEKEQAAAGREHAMRFGESGRGVGDTAKCRGRNDGIEGTIGTRQRFGTAGDKLHRPWRTLGLASRKLEHSRVGIDAGHRFDRRWVAVEVEPGAHAELKHAPARRGQLIRCEILEFRLI